MAQVKQGCQILNSVLATKVSVEVCDVELIHWLTDLLLSRFDVFCLLVIIHGR